MRPREAPKKVVARKPSELAAPSVPVSATLREVWVVDFWRVGICPENRRYLDVIEPIQKRKCLLDLPVAPRDAGRSVIADSGELDVSHRNSHGQNLLWQGQGEQLGQNAKEVDTSPADCSRTAPALGHANERSI